MIYKQTLTQTLAAGTLTTEFYNPGPNEVTEFLGTTPPPSGPPPVGDSFPTDPYDAPFPSPVKSSIPSKPYLRDKIAGIFKLDTANPPTTYYPVTPTGYQAAFAGFHVSVNDVVQNPDKGPPTTPDWETTVGPWGIIYYTQLMMDAQGFVWAKSCAGQWYKYTGAQFDLDNAGPIFEPPAPIVMPPDPPRAAIPPGSTGRVVKVGPSQVGELTYNTITAYMLTAVMGDTVELDPVVFNESVVIDKTIRWKGAPGGGTKFDGAGVAYKMGGRGLIIPTVDQIFDDIEFVGTGMESATSNLTSAIRPTGAPLWLELNRCGLFDNQCGIGTDGGPASNVIILNDCEFQRNGLEDGQSHNIYLGTSTIRLEFKNLVSGSPTNGHALKSRAWDVQGDGGTFDSAHGAPIEMGHGTAKPFSLKNITINKAAGDDNHNLFSYGVDGALNGSAGGTITGVINALCVNPITQVKLGTVDMTGGTWTGNRPVVNDGAGTVMGLPT